ncbi:MAG TPA: Gfo/Idh/MocA family oxidoreductase [Pyrinomonadaceae bacterium]|nr:Gfo/Idh/MocA family oxidoreductase [Pyrinomonadaceae bacterium]
MNWGLIGAGDIARKRIAPALRDLENCNLSAISRKNVELAESFAKEFSAEKSFADWRELIADDDIEAVYLATPVFLHKEQTIAAAEAGKHVLCEKPMALNVKECDEMIAACRVNNVKFGIAYYRRFYPIIERVKQIIATDEIGKPVMAQINSFEFFNPTAEHPRFWLIEKGKSGGGPMMDFGCHRLEVLVNLFGEVSKVKSLVANVAFEREVEDTATALLQFESGTCASVTVTHAAREPQDTLSIFGTKGSIHIPVLNQANIQIKTENGDRIESHPTHPNVHLPLIADFTNAILEDRAPLVSGEIGKLIQVLESRIYNGE